MSLFVTEFTLIDLLKYFFYKRLDIFHLASMILSRNSSVLKRLSQRWFRVDVCKCKTIEQTSFKMQKWRICVLVFFFKNVWNILNKNSHRILQLVLFEMHDDMLYISLNNIVKNPYTICASMILSNVRGR